MKISIITVCYNSASTIEDTIKSVISQDYADLEYIIIDGGSTDETLKIVGKYQDKIAKVVSEPDRGIYDAMNKGIKLASGDIVGIINSDDFYSDNKVLDKVAGVISGGVDACYGDLAYVNRQDVSKQVRYWKAGEYEKRKLSYGWIMPHPVFFVKKEVYNRFGLFNLSFKIAADYELMLRFLLKGISVVYIPETLVCMREGGHSAENLKQRMAGWREIKSSWEVNNKQIPKFIIFKRLLSKIFQFI